MTLTYIRGDLIHSPFSGKRLIPHICNDRGGWGAGFVLAISKQWRQPEEKYRQWYSDGQYIIKTSTVEKVIPFRLGMVQYVPVGTNTIVVNMIGQHGTVSKDNRKPIKYGALYQCMSKIEVGCRGSKDIEIHAPKFGSGLAQGNWDFIEEFINEVWVDNGLKVFIYEL